MSLVTQFVFDVDSSKTQEKNIGKCTGSMTSPMVKLNYRSDMIHFKCNRKIVLSSSPSAELLKQYDYVMQGTMMYFKNSTLTISFGGLIGEFTLNEQQNERLLEDCSSKWVCYIK